MNKQGHRGHGVSFDDGKHRPHESRWSKAKQ